MQAVNGVKVELVRLATGPCGRALRSRQAPASRPSPRPTCCTSGTGGSTPGDRQARRDVRGRGRRLGADARSPGHTANTIAKLRADVLAGNAPPAVQLKGPEIAEWAATGHTADLNELAGKENWDERRGARALIGVMKPEDAWVAAPMNIHRINWMWAQQEGAGQGRRHRDAQDLGRVQRGGREDRRRPASTRSRIEQQDWIDATLFEIIVYGMDHRALPPGLHRARPGGAAGRGHGRASFDQLRKMVELDRRAAWPAATGTRRCRCSEGESGFHLPGRLGDRHFNGDGLKEGDGLSVRPRAARTSSEPGFILNSDSVIFFKRTTRTTSRGPGAAGPPDHVARVPDDLQPGQGLDPGAHGRRSGRASTPASSWRWRTCRRRSRPTIWWSAWRTTWRCRRNSAARCSR